MFSMLLMKGHEDLDTRLLVSYLCCWYWLFVAPFILKAQQVHIKAIETITSSTICIATIMARAAIAVDCWSFSVLLVVSVVYVTVVAGVPACDCSIVASFATLFLMLVGAVVSLMVTPVSELMQALRL